MGRARSVRATTRIHERRMSPGFTAFGLRDIPGYALDPFLSLDEFRMSEPTFPPHPHAGFSAVTYMFEDSHGTFTNRDSLGNDDRIGPGTLHWSQAARGMMHEEIPETRGVECHGLQMFVNLRSDDKQVPPRAFHVDARAIPEIVAAEGARAGFAGDGDEIQLKAGGDGLHVLLAAGKPLGEPVVFGGPFVMTNRSELQAAFDRYERGEMGSLSPSF